jgi:general secretion pathway protein G
MNSFIHKFLRKKHRGFSLIEIMAVVVIMGIVAAGVVNIVGSNAEKAKHTQAEKDLDSILAAMGTAYTEAGSFGTVTTNKDLAAAFAGTYKTKLEGQLSRELADISDPWGNGYGIVSTYNDTTKAGKITLVCTKTAATYDTTTNCRVNTYNGSKKMYRVVYSQ